jgi:hypothetical protein
MEIRRLCRQRALGHPVFSASTLSLSYVGGAMHVRCDRAHAQRYCGTPPVV